MKKKIPLILLREIQPKIDQHRKLIRPVLKTDALFHLIDNDSKSDLYFKIYNSNVGKYVTDFKPKNPTSILNSKSEQTLESVGKQFDTWIDIIKGYNSIVSIYDDPIIEAYQKEFETKFTIVDEDAEYAPFDLERQLFIDNYLEKIILKLEAAITENNKAEIEDIINDSKSLKNEQTQLCKKQVVERLSQIWAKTRKFGVTLLKEIYAESKKELIKQLIKGMLDQ